MSFAPARTLLASLLVASAALAAGPTPAQRAAHAKFLGSWWAVTDAAQAEANKFDVRGAPNRAMTLKVTRANLGLVDVVLEPVGIGIEYASDEFMHRIPGTSYARATVLRLKKIDGKYWLSGLDRISRQVLPFSMGAPFPPNFNYQLVHHK